MSTATTTTEYRIYVACLASYNAGTLHGVWIHVDNVETMDSEIRYMLKGSPHPNIIKRDHECVCGHEWSAQVRYGDTANLSGEKSEYCSECNAKSVMAGPQYPSAEEYAVHDYDGIPSSFGEYPDLEELVAVAEILADDNGKLMLEYRDHVGCDIDELADQFNEAYYGQHDNVTDYAHEYVESTGMLQGVDENIQRYFDFEAFGRDMELGDDIFTITLDGECHVFSNHV